MELKTIIFPFVAAVLTGGAFGYDDDSLDGLFGRLGRGNIPIARGAAWSFLRLRAAVRAARKLHLFRGEKRKRSRRHCRQGTRRRNSSERARAISGHCAFAGGDSDAYRGGV